MASACADQERLFERLLERLLERLEPRLGAIERKLDAVLAMLEPVHSHAEWVDGLRSRLHRIGLMRDTPRIAG
jgi:hypothetical protein